MKTLIISIGDYKNITLISKYTTYFERNKIDYDIVCTERYGATIKRKHVISFQMNNNETKIKKIVSLLKFKKWAIKIIKRNKYDLVIVWNENTALLFSHYLLSKYKKKYIVNIRDVDFLNQKILNIIRARVIKESAFSTYCSTAKLSFPKGYKYILMRSVNSNILSEVPKKQKWAKNRPIRIVYIGKIRFPEADREIIKAFGNDERYELWFIGMGSESLGEYKKKYKNVRLIGKYEPEETSDYLKKADVINSYFGTKVLGYERMTSIRFSYAPYIGIPVIVGSGTNMEKEGKKYGFAYGFDNKDIKNESERFYKWYNNINIAKFREGCKKYQNDSKESDKIFYKKLKDTLYGDKNK